MPKAKIITASKVKEDSRLLLDKSAEIVTHNGDVVCDSHQVEESVKEDEKQKEAHPPLACKEKKEIKGVESAESKVVFDDFIVRLESSKEELKTWMNEMLTSFQKKVLAAITSMKNTNAPAVDSTSSNMSSPLAEGALSMRRTSSLASETSVTSKASSSNLYLEDSDDEVEHASDAEEVQLLRSCFGLPFAEEDPDCVSAAEFSVMLDSVDWKKLAQCSCRELLDIR